MIEPTSLGKPVQAVEDPKYSQQKSVGHADDGRTIRKDSDTTEGVLSQQRSELRSNPKRFAVHQDTFDKATANDLDVMVHRESGLDTQERSVSPSDGKHNYIPMDGSTQTPGDTTPYYQNISDERHYGAMKNPLHNPLSDDPSTLTVDDLDDLNIDIPVQDSPKSKQPQAGMDGYILMGERHYENVSAQQKADGYVSMSAPEVLYENTQGRHITEPGATGASGGVADSMKSGDKASLLAGTSRDDSSTLKDSSASESAVSQRGEVVSQQFRGKHKNRMAMRATKKTEKAQDKEKFSSEKDVEKRLREERKQLERLKLQQDSKLHEAEKDKEKSAFGNMDKLYDPKKLSEPALGEKSKDKGSSTSKSSLAST